jgi:exonuclease SbcD
MRLLHVSDWHLGRVTYRCSRAPDHDEVLTEILELARQVRPHLICHTGDVWDALRPAHVDLQRGIEALQALATVAPVVVVCGNHESPLLYKLFARLVGDDAPLRFVDQARPPAEGGILEIPGDGDEIIRLAPLPFVHANRMVERFEDSATWTAAYADRIHLIEDALGRGLTDGYDSSRHVLLFAAHLHVTGARFSGSERPLHVSDAYASRLERLPRVSYAAFGHIHRPQALPGTAVTGRYAGSPICLDFGEEGQEKEAVIVEAEPGRPARVTTHRLSGGRPLRTLSGTLDELRAIAPLVGRALCRVTVQTKTPLSDLTERVRELLPEAELLDVMEDCEAKRIEPVNGGAAITVEEASFSELFRAYLEEQGTKGSAADRVLKAFDSLIQAIELEEPVRFAEADLLQASAPVAAIEQEGQGGGSPAPETKAQKRKSRTPAGSPNPSKKESSGRASSVTEKEDETSLHSTVDGAEPQLPAVRRASSEPRRRRKRFKRES